MTNLGIMGGVSLGTINQWISLIDTNLTNSKRIGYKETRVSMTSGEVNTIGMTQGPGKIMPIAFPSASLLIGKTQILDYVQGNLTQTGHVTDFALNGRGYFVVEDKLGNRYATRDGQFNFDTDGYLVTQEGLRVLTTGFDYVRVPASESFAVNSYGESISRTYGLTRTDAAFNPGAGGISDISESIYGNRKLLVIDIPDADKLVYSKYGYTKFDLGKRVPVVVRNDFSTTMDGIAAYLIPDAPAVYDTSTIPPTLVASAMPMSNFFKHDLKNQTVKMSTHDSTGLVRYVQAAYGGQQYKDFTTQLDFHIRSNESGNKLTGSFGSFGITFGKSSHSSIDSDSDAFFAGIINNQFVVKRGTTTIGGPFNVTGIDMDNPFSTLPLPSNTEIKLKLDVTDGVLNVSLIQDSSATNLNFSVTLPNYNGGYMSVGNSIQESTVGTFTGTIRDEVFDFTNLTIIERNQDSKYTTNVLQQNVRDIWKEGANAQIRETMVMQQYVEESTSTLADTLPLLSHAQKMFGAISKVISVYNSITDDMNNTIR